MNPVFERSMMLKFDLSISTALITALPLFYNELPSWYKTFQGFIIVLLCSLYFVALAISFSFVRAHQKNPDPVTWKEVIFHHIPILLTISFLYIQGGDVAYFRSSSLAAIVIISTSVFYIGRFLHVE